LAAGIMVVDSLEVAVRAIASASLCGQVLGDPSSAELIASRTPRGRDSQSPEPPVIATARTEGRTVLTEPEARKIAAAAGVPVVAATWCRTQEEAARVAVEIGGPVAVRVVSATISHKTEAGGVALDVIGGLAASEAYTGIVAAVQAYAASHGLEPDVRGALVSSMLEPPIAELLIGVRRDPEFGPVVVIGPGGVAVELYGDPAIRVLPVTASEVATMFSDPSVAPILGGYRGRPPADRQALVDLTLSLATCFETHPGISEIEVNPVFAYSDSAVAVDIRAFLDTSALSCS
jgi:acyl-CoA synthetase (NDP forming)